jgi:hypothetical protein
LIFRIDFPRTHDTLRPMTFRRLIVLSVLLTAVVAQTRKRADSPDIQEIREYRLSLDKIQRYVDSYKIMAQDPAAAPCFNKPPGNQPTLDLGQKQIESCPSAVADLKKAGLAPREFLILGGSLMRGVFAMEMKHRGQIKEYPPTAVSPENAAFLDQNYDKVKALTAPLMNQRSGGDDK